jgi:hypothetical protein
MVFGDRLADLGVLPPGPQAMLRAPPSVALILAFRPGYPSAILLAVTMHLRRSNAWWNICLSALLAVGVEGRTQLLPWLFQG